MNRLKSIFSQIRITISGLVQRLVRHYNVNKWHETSDNSVMTKEKYKAIRELSPLLFALNKKTRELDKQGIYVYGEVRQDDPMTGRAPIFHIDVFNRTT